MRKVVPLNALGLALLFCIATGIASAQTFTTLADFNQTNGATPLAAMTQGLDGNLYGTTYGDFAPVSGTLFKITTAGQLTTLYTFCSQVNCNDGSYPHAAVVQDRNGNFWGTTEGFTPPYGSGAVFKVTAAGVLTTMHSFSGTDGAHPRAGLTLGSDGNFYGTTSSGGSNDAGTVSKSHPQAHSQRCITISSITMTRTAVWC